MAAGIPGIGIGGLFYIISALLIPVREARRALRGERGHMRRRHAWRLFGMSVAILAATWLVGVMVGALLLSQGVPSSPSAGFSSRVQERLSDVRVSVLAIWLGTLGLVLLSVQVGRLTLGDVHRRRREQRRAARRAVDHLMLLAIIGAGLASPAASAAALDAQAAPAPQPTRTLQDAGIARARAESLYAARNRAAAESAYAVLLTLQPDDSRALYRLAELRSARPRAAIPLLRRYVALEPADAWGWIALGDALSRGGEHKAALIALERAQVLAPGERDVSMARARALSRRGEVDRAIAVYEERVASDARDVEAWQGLAEQRRRAGRLSEAIWALETAQSIAPSDARTRQHEAWRREAGVHLEPTVASTRDSDHNVTQRASVAVRLPARGRSAFTLHGGVGDATNIDEAARLQFVSATVNWRPRSALQVNATGGAMRASATLANDVTSPAPLPRPGVGRRSPAIDSAVTTPVGSVRLRWNSASGGPSLDLRGVRAVLDATPALLLNGVVRDEASVSLEVPLLAGFRVRTLARGGRLESAAEPANTRTLLGGTFLRRIPGWGEVGVNGQQLQLARPTTQGYFAPRDAQLVELSSYIERESDRGVLLALDAGMGMQRMRRFDMAAPGAWQPAARLWSHLDVPVSRSVMLRAELDIFDGGVARDADVAASKWRWYSAAVGVQLRP